MNTDLQRAFDYQGAQVRTVIKDGEPWFILKDVCEILHISNVTDLKNRLNAKGLGQIELLTNGGKQVAYVISESNLYKAILRSDKEEAEIFGDWVTEEVLPSIRKHGAYMTTETIEKVLTDPDTIIQIATQLKHERQARTEAEKKPEEQKPLVMFAESCIASNDCLLVRELAKLASKNGIVIGEKRLWQKLREWGEVSKKNEPYQHSMDAGRWEVKQGTYNTPYGSETYRTFKVSPKGQVYIIERLKNEVTTKAS